MAAVWFAQLESGRVVDPDGRPYKGGLWLVGHDDGTVTWEAGVRAKVRAASGTFPTAVPMEVPDTVRRIMVQRLASERATPKPQIRVPDDRPLPPPPPVVVVPEPPAPPPPVDLPGPEPGTEPEPPAVRGRP